MRHTPQEEIALLEPGEYEASIKSAKDAVSKSGNDMIELILTVYATSGTTDVFDYLVATSKGAWKIRHFCKSAGIDYDSGELNTDVLKDLNVRVKLVVDKQEGFDPKNSVRDYLDRNDNDEDEIPF